MAAWWFRYPWVLAREESALQEGGFPFERDAAAFAQGRLVLKVGVTIRGKAREVTAYYPDSFPYFAPQVLLAGSRFAKHHNLEGWLCPLASDGEDWTPSRDTLARILAEQLPAIEAANEPDLSNEQRGQIEEHAGEPLSNFLPYAQPPEVLLLPDEFPPQHATRGTMTLQVHAGLKSRGQVFGEVRTISDASGALLVENRMHGQMFTASVRGFWARLAQRPEVPQVLSREQLMTVFRDLICANSPPLQVALNAAKRGEVLVAGLLFRDELSWTAESEDWVFLKFHVTSPRRGKNGVQYQYGFIRSDRAGTQSFLQRAPFLKPLRSKRVLLIGAGNVGAPIALQLARAGVGQLDLVDQDLLQVGNTVRWPLGRRYAGQQKVFALADAIRNDFPFTMVSASVFKIGAAATVEGDEHDYDDMVRRLITAADLVVDGTANVRVAHFLSDLCAASGKTYLWLSTTHGATGGIVGRIVPGKGQGCYQCFLHSWGESVPEPPVAEIEPVQPGGCTHPTFVGAGLDTDELSLMASRLAVATLCKGEDGGYKDFDWDIGVCALQRDGSPIAPQWTTLKLEAHPSCPACNPPSQ